jgi:hypothetical protein
MLEIRVPTELGFARMWEYPGDRAGRFCSTKRSEARADAAPRRADREGPMGTDVLAGLLSWLT